MEFSAVNPSRSGYRWSSCWGLGFKYRLVPDSRRVRRNPNGHRDTRKVHVGRAGTFPAAGQINVQEQNKQANRKKIKKEGRKGREKNNSLTVSMREYDLLSCVVQRHRC